jgi:orotate phosphoribosyltransferase
VSRFDQGVFNRFLIDHRVVGFFDEAIRLKSGRESHWYVNWRTVAGDVFLIDQLADFLIAFAHDHGLDPDGFYGVPEGASKLGVLATYKWVREKPGFGPGSHALPMGRGKQKEHGVPEDRFFLTPPRGRIVVVEDVTTTGQSLLAALDQLQEIDVEVAAAVGLTNRMERRDDGSSVEEAVRAKGVAYFALSDATQFLPAAVRAFSPRAEIVRSIEKEFEQYGVRPLRLTK